MKTVRDILKVKGDNVWCVEAGATVFEEAGIARLPAHHLALRVQPDEGISLVFRAKEPGPGMALDAVPMDFSYGSSFRTRPTEAYERLLHDAMAGDQTLFLREDAVERSWEIVAPVLDLGHILEKHRTPIEYADDQIAQLARVLEWLAGIHADQAVAGTKITGRLADVRDLDRPLQFQRRELISGHPVRIHEHLDHAWPPANDICPRHLLDSRQMLCELLRHAA